MPRRLSRDFAFVLLVGMTAAEAVIAMDSFRGTVDTIFDHYDRKAWSDLGAFMAGEIQPEEKEEFLETLQQDFRVPLGPVRQYRITGSRDLADGCRQATLDVEFDRGSAEVRLELCRQEQSWRLKWLQIARGPEQALRSIVQGLLPEGSLAIGGAACQSEGRGELGRDLPHVVSCVFTLEGDPACSISATADITEDGRLVTRPMSRTDACEKYFR